MPTAFYSRQWFRYVSAVFCTLLAAFGLVIGPPFLFGILKDANGQPAVDAGIALTLLSIPLTLVATLHWFQIAARRRPVVRLCQEAIEVNVIGSSALDGAPFVPPLVRVAWLILSLQGFRSQIGWIPWSLFRGVHVAGIPMARRIIIEGAVIYPSFVCNQSKATFGDGIEFDDAEFVAPLDQIAAAIESFHADPDARAVLPRLME